MYSDVVSGIVSERLQEHARFDRFSLHFCFTPGAPWHRNRGTESLYLGCCSSDQKLSINIHCGDSKATAKHNYTQLVCPEAS